MKIVKSGYEILSDISQDGKTELELIEKIGRTCYKSESKTGSFEETKNFVRNLIKRKHLAMIEHSMLSVKFICDRGISHEIVRHRIASFAQESTRWCNYSKGRFGGEITVVEPNFSDGDKFGYESEDYSYSKLLWKQQCQKAEELYMYLTGTAGVSAQQARSVLPTCLKTEIVMTTNYREWRHFFELRNAKDAHPQIRKLAKDLLLDLNSRIPVIFEDLVEKMTKEDE